MDIISDFKFSESIANLASALTNFQAKCPIIDLDANVVVKRRDGGQYDFDYATFMNIKKSTKDLMGEHGLAITQWPTGRGKMTTMLVHSSGEWIYGTFEWPNVPTAAQEFGSMLTYLKRYSFCATLGIVADEDEDGNMSDGNRFDKTEGGGKGKGKGEAKPETKKNTGLISLPHLQNKPK